jgi:hypothetical protein
MQEHAMNTQVMVNNKSLDEQYRAGGDTNE